MQSEFYLPEDDLAEELEPAGAVYEAGPESLSFSRWSREQRHAGRPRGGQLPGRASGTDGEGSPRCAAALSGISAAAVPSAASAKRRSSPPFLFLSLIQLNHAQSITLAASHAGCLLSIPKLVLFSGVLHHPGLRIMCIMDS